MDDLCACGGANGCLIHPIPAEEPLSAHEARAVLDRTEGRAADQRALSSALPKLEKLAASAHRAR